MPYSSTSELPQSVRDKYSDKCQRAYMHAFNSVHEDTHDEGRAAAAGHSAAQDCEAKKGMNISGSVDRKAEFQIFSGILKANRSSDGRMRLHGIASSTTRDLHGDVMEASAIEDMERAANNNLTIFLNHSYNVPEDVAGSVEKAVMKTRGVDHDGNPNYDLDMDVVINDDNERAVKAFNAIERGTKLGLSIGALIPDGGATKDKKSGAWLIQHVELLETSIVSIPANPRSWVEYAAKSLRSKEPELEKAAMTVPVGQPTLTLDGQNYRIEGTVEGLSLANNATTNSINSTTTNFDFINDSSSPFVASAEPTVGEQPETEVADAAMANCPYCEPGEPCEKHKAIEPDVTDATVTVIQIDTGDGSSESDSDSSGDTSQEGSATDPENGEFAASGDDAAAITADISQDGVSDTVQRMLDLLSKTSGELVTARTEVIELRGEVATLTRERDTAIEERQQVLIETKRVLDKVANSPLVRKAVVVEAQADLRSKFSGYLSDDLIKMMER